MTKEPLFIRFLNKEAGVMDMLHSFAQSPDEKTSKIASKAINAPPDLESFRTEFYGAVIDIKKSGPGEEFASFVNNYMEPSLEEDITVKSVEQGENRSQTVRIKDEKAPWMQGFICYNLCLFIKAFGLDVLKRCEICEKFFSNKGKYAVYCSDGCKSQGKKNKKKA